MLEKRKDFKFTLSGRTQSKEAVFLFDEYTYKSIILRFVKADDYWLKH
jgi:hypothetical protein